MTNLLMPIPAGTVFLVTTDCYSSYSVRAVLKALRDLDPPTLREEWLTAHPDQRESYKFKEAEFIGALVASGAVEELPVWEWHLGDYGEFGDGNTQGRSAYSAYVNRCELLTSA